MSSPPDDRLMQAASAFSANDLERAETLCRTILNDHPDHAGANHLLGLIALRCGHLEDAEALIRQSLLAAPIDADALSNLGEVLKQRGRFAEAAEQCRRALALRPEHSAALNNLGNALECLDHPHEAIQAYRRAVAACPDSPEAHLNLAYTLLRDGQLAEGLAEYEWRWKWAGFSNGNRKQPPLPRWRGQDVRGQRVLILAEQGLGDTLQFIRYAPLVSDRGARVVVQCQPPLKRLIARMRGVEEVAAEPTPPPPADVACPVMSLPLAMQTTMQSIPAHVPYLSADPADVQKWRERIGHTRELKVGLSWAGSATQRHNHRRSIPLAMLSPLSQVLGVRFFRLQKEKTAGESVSAFSGELIDWTDELRDFADTAALIENLDLVITVCTSVAHLAGGLGKRTWTMLPHLSDWRWFHARQDSPWYPTMRLFRQKTLGDWPEVIERVTGALREEVIRRAEESG